MASLQHTRNILCCGTQNTLHRRMPIQGVGMKYAVDLHIHSALSPCAHEDMTPNNIVNMAVMKGLDAIALTDHNSGANLEAVSICARNHGLVFIPGMELESCEEVHLVCLLPNLKSAMKLHDIVYDSLPAIRNRKDIFGSQYFMDDKDRIIGEEERLLITASSLTADEVFSLVRGLGGAVIPAHVDRPSYSMLSNLGLIPEVLGIKHLEISKNCDESAFRATHPELDGYRLIRSSDAHYLGDILERENMIEVPEYIDGMNEIRKINIENMADTGLSPHDIINLFV